MKRFSKVSLSIIAACLLMTPTFVQAQDYAGDTTAGTIDLNDTNATTGGGPGVMGIPVAAASLVRYDGGSADGMGYTTGNCTPGEVMTVSSVSTSSSPAVRLFFAARDSVSADGTNCPADNNIYQAAATTVQTDENNAPTNADLDTVVSSSGAFSDADSTGTGWMVRGGS